ncbi:DUF4276 family protein [Rahnella sp. CFA14(1/10)]|uniref:DUF4276 family protein n=1 Tax=Rahnella sp. CFA14(1/10) TaxID=2511203 RepID=UPI0013EE8797|nr:DUF4276 family protein [Rahnella sp. CFA14(1/10)]
MSKKIAIFVEGLTEQEFVIKLIQELAGKRGVVFEVRKQHKSLLDLVELRTDNTLNPEIFVLMVNCATDSQVKSQIRDQFQNLKNAGYSTIIGLRDIYPDFKRQDVPRLQQSLYLGLVMDPALPINLHLAILEIEAWFLEELTHFARIDAGIKLQNIVNAGFDPSSSRAYELDHPADTLHLIYNSVGKAYNKTKKHIQRTVEALSYDSLYVDVRGKSPSLDAFVSSLESAIF